MKNNDSLMNINDMLFRMEATLQNVDSAENRWRILWMQAMLS